MSAVFAYFYYLFYFALNVYIYIYIFFLSAYAQSTSLKIAIIFLYPVSRGGQTFLPEGHMGHPVGLQRARIKKNKFTR